MAVSKNRVPLQGSERSVAQNATSIGATNPDEMVEVTVRLRSKDPSKATMTTRVSREDYAKACGASEDDIHRVQQFARDHNLTVVSSNAAHRSVILRGTVAQVSAAFSVELRNVKWGDAICRARTGPVYIPQDLQDVVTGVFGLDNRPQAKPHFRRPLAAVTGSFSPLQVAAAYSFPNTATSGKNQCIGIIELGGGYSSADLDQYFQNLGLTTPTVKTVSVSGGQNSPGSDADGEVMLDIEVAGAIAPAATIAMYFAPNSDDGFLNAITTAVHDTTNRPSVISISWGGPESSWTTQSMDAFDEEFQAAASMGVTVCCASGDDGASDGVSQGLAVDFPASSPFALGCGGTKLTVTGDTPNDVVWNELNNNEGATGGGFSAHFATPSYQNAVSPKPKMRGVPDVAGNADPETGYNVRVDGQDTVIGGTSAVAPLMAGLIACINANNGKSAGFINATIYGNASAFRDVTSGNNGGQNAGKGWDACTGLGVPIGTKVQEVLASATAGSVEPSAA
jgi:kumamolisin